ncbi:CRISPR-associated helicase/endonuclease Cas3 [Blastochloris viridis]|uniref:CRISPR-associated helicase Cas3 n=1 Tax=Blastochloris viridis TaxID=1079 RepID=A0A0H5BG57_BLAVI|nr:CRISPR-associated helicase/endonuclease Cas3 [Blastochloris viridis]ALK09983.1 DEAD/DEAH box helicase [Blastochloris viridis]BAS00100.1 CRISPR-associated helicase Cas3 [Blastochloris viridis]CUU42646.1 CRISPR-associated helicase Cas3 [Blastochloris viridis]
MYFAHSTDDPDRERWQELAQHLANVAGMAAKRADAFGAGPIAALAGQFHDLGKYAPEFLRYILGQGPSPDHATAGAREILALAFGGKDRLAAQLAAFCVAGHHAGLPDRIGSASSLDQRVKKTLPPLDPVWRQEIAPQVGTLFPGGFRGDDKRLAAFQLALLGRMVFSCLVDADYRDTETFYTAARGERIDREWTPLPDIVDGLIARFDAHMADVAARAEATPVNSLRAEILAHVRAKASLPKGVFTLTVPTGGGKTLASLGFALDHAKRHGLSRIVYSIPFTSIIDQTADIFRQVLGEQVVLEHHSAIEEAKIDDDGERSVRDKMRLAMEDWAAPVIVTTNVQLLESLFAARPSRCRKLHNLANAVIVLDEAQAIPLNVLRPSIVALDELARNYGATIVLCTATQPALDTSRFEHGFRLEQDRELAPEPARLQQALKRITLRRALAPCSDRDLIAELTDCARGLVIVNSRKHALALYRAAKAAGLEGLVHLTTRQTAADRRRILARVRVELAAQRPCRVIATSLIEAGVDISFPRVWRAEAGLDQILQAAGRCNREGRDPPEDSIVTVFKPADAEPPPEIKAFAEATARTALHHADLTSLDAIERYFEEVYWQKGEGLDRLRIGGPDSRETRAVLDCFSVSAGQLQFAYRTVGDNFRLIESGLAPVIIAVEDDATHALDGLRGGWLTPGAAARKLQTFLVQVPPRDRARLINDGEVEFADAERQFAVLRNEGLYTVEEGLVWEEGDQASALLII